MYVSTSLIPRERAHGKSSGTKKSCMRHPPAYIHQEHSVPCGTHLFGPVLPTLLC